MPTPSQHRRKITENREFVSYLQAGRPSYLGWEITGLFYAALHQVERHLAEKLNKHCRTHEERNDWISRHAILRQIWPQYRDLQHMSRQRRYSACATAPTDVSDAEQFLSDIERRLA